MAEKRQAMAALREEQRALRQRDRLDNIERQMRAQDFHNSELKARFALQDEREANRKAQLAALVESNREASLLATQRKQELVEKLAAARSEKQLLKLAESLPGGLSLPMPSTPDASPAATPAASPARPESARPHTARPRPPDGPSTARPSSARARLV